MASSFDQFLFGTGPLAAQQYPQLGSPPPRMPTPFVDVAERMLRPSPDQAAAIFTGGADLGLPQPFDPQFGGTDFSGLLSPEGIVPGVPLGSQGEPYMGSGGDMGAPLLTASQMAQDAKAQSMIDARYPLAGTFDPMQENIAATANLRKLEELLPSSNRPVLGEGGAFEQDESGAYRNVPDLPITAGDEAEVWKLQQKYGADIERMQANERARGEETRKTQDYTRQGFTDEINDVDARYQAALAKLEAARDRLDPAKYDELKGRLDTQYDFDKAVTSGKYGVKMPDPLSGF